MENTLKILFLDDSKTDVDLIIRFLKKGKISFDYIWAFSRETFTKALHEHSFDLIISDHTLPQFDGIEAFRIVKSINANIPFIITTGTVSEKTILEYSKEGIDDYILKENLLRLPSAIENVISKKKIEVLHAKLKIAHKNIQDSIRYAKFIQNAVLPTEHALLKEFPEAFILFEPKDILSGDFYWFKKNHDSFLIAVADCTGHGVPGALLAMMGHNILNEALLDEKNVVPSAMLSYLNAKVRNVLNHNSTSLHDGMDIAFCNINLQTRTLSYAGAKRPLFIISNTQLIEYESNRISIGESECTINQFNGHEITLQKGDRLFMFSDGIVDQFHFETRKKILTKRLKELLMNTSGNNMQEQKKQVETFFKDWKGNLENTDDVLLIGIEI